MHSENLIDKITKITFLKEGKDDMYWGINALSCQGKLRVILEVLVYS